MVQLNFDATTVAPSQPPEALETGWYPANLINTEMKPTKDGQGQYLEVTFRISSGAATGRTFKSRLNLQNKSQQAVDIAYAELSAICHAVGKLRVGQAMELHGGVLEVYLKRVPRNDNASLMTNDVAGYRAPGANGNQPGFSGAVGTQTAAAPAWVAAPPVAQPPVQQPTYAPPPSAVGAPPPAPAGGTAVPPWARG